MNQGFNDLLQLKFLGNTVQAYGTAALTFAGVLAGAYIAHRILVGRLRKLAAKTGGGFDDFLVNLLAKISSLDFAVIALYLATHPLQANPTFHKIIHVAFVIVLSWRAVTLAQELLGYVLRNATEKVGIEDAHASSALRNIQHLLNGVIWVGALLFVLDNLGVNITAAVAGLGIGGIAVAMAAQQILGDLFSSFVIFTDKPFKVGDFIIVGDMMGTVDYVGIKTTRIRSLGGEMLVFSNSDLTNSRIRNYKLMKERRVVFGFGVVYQTPYDKVRTIPDIVKDVVGGVKEARLDRVHFKAFGSSSLDFEVVYYVLSGDYNLYMDIQQTINLGLMKRFEEQKIEFAYPTQTLYLNK
ncbi:MAG: mechanosensitive ion channel domain-containing protein [Elusimicrobiota bacterium]